MQTPAQLANLKPIQKGEVRNPTGKTGPHIKTIAQRIFNDPETWNRLPIKDKSLINDLKKMVGKDATYGEALIYAWQVKALNDPRWASIILDLTDGKGKTEIDVSGTLNLALVKFVGNDDSTNDATRDN